MSFSAIIVADNSTKNISFSPQWHYSSVSHSDGQPTNIGTAPIFTQYLGLFRFKKRKKLHLLLFIRILNFIY
jgi:hypothetical protein